MAITKEKIQEVIFGADTIPGKIFDILLIGCILMSVAIVTMISIPSINKEYGKFLNIAEWSFTLLFTVEYFVRIYCVKKPKDYVFSFFGIIDLIAIIPTYLIFFFPHARFISTIRILRALRVFRILNLNEYVDESKLILTALLGSSKKILVFMLSIFSLVVILGSLIYVAESGHKDFNNIPQCIYWAIVTITTVGYGDIVPHSVMGKIIASIFMILGYAIIAVPTGIVTVEIANAGKKTASVHACKSCNHDDHDSDAIHCKICGVKL